MKTIAQRLTICCLLLWCFMGSTMAQDAPFVIKKDGHYLAHVKVNGNWVLQDATTFSPDCIWYSGTEFNSSGLNHNYYFKEVFENGTTNYHFLSAELVANGALSYSATMPYTYLLRNRDGIYYFYDWDYDHYPDGGGLARAYQYTNVTTQTECENCGASWGQSNGECWKVYWVEFRDNEWKLSATSSYGIPENGARFRQVTVTENVTVLANSGLRALNADGTAVSSIVMDYSGDRDRDLSATIETPYQFTLSSDYIFQNTSHPISNTYSVGLLTSPYHWTISGEGKDYLSFESGSQVLTSHEATPTLYYRTENYSGDKTATLTLTVSYQYGYTQTLSVPVTLQTSCQNPRLAASPVITNTDVTVSWYNTNASAYKLWWKKETNGEWASIDKGTETSHTFSVTDLEYETTYQYWISAKCGDDYLPLSSGTDPFEFTTKPEPNLIIYGDLYGGGRMANVSGNPEIVIINCDNISSVYGGNDIAGAVQGTNGTKIQIGVNSGDANYASLGVTQDTITIGSVYGGGNGYYAYNGTSFTAASETYSSQEVASGASVNVMTQNNQVGDVVWTNDATEAVTLNFPTIIKTEIAVATDYVKVDSLFGGAKNAFLTQDGVDNNGSSITIDGGTLFAVFGGNNIGGTVGTAKHHIVVNQTKTKMALGIQSDATTGYGRDFGIRYLFGGGNKVPGSTTDILITGGQMDTIFGGGNLASVTASYMEVACTAGASSGDYTFGKVYSNAIASYTNDKFVIKESDYDWDGNGIYNIHTLFGGNNKADMYGVPHITLTSGSVGTAYGGGNAGDMKAHLEDGSITTFVNHQQPQGKTLNFKYGTKIEMTHPNMVVDYLYGGCQVSNVDYSTWVEITDGNIGSVYGGCNVSGDVGSTRIYQNAPGPKSEQYQAVQGGTYVRATGGTVYRDFFAGSNGFYHCNDGTKYKAGVDYGDPEQYYIGKLVPTHNETHLFISKDEDHPNGVTIKGDAYTGGNLACVGFTNFTVPKVNNDYLPYPQFVGLSSLHMDGGTVEGSVYGGGRMASVYGSNEVKVDGGVIGGALYGGNDRTGQVAQITNRVWPDNEYSVASDGYTSLSTVNTYVGITGIPNINTVYGGGNGDYVYEGEEADMEYCLLNDQPIQSNTFVDIHLEDAGRINTVFGGGNGVTVTGEITVFLNVNVEDPNHYASPDENHVGTIFGGNNLGSLDILSNILLLRGKVGNVYGGCNEGAMVGSTDLAGTSYTDVGSYVRLLNEYPDGANSVMTPFAEVTGAVYGGCRMNGVTNNSLVLVEGGNHPHADIYGGSDISGDVAGISQVVVTSGTHNNGPVIANAFGGGNGDYDYTSGAYQGLNQPYCVDSRVIMLGGTAGNLFAGGNDGECGHTQMQVEGGTVTGRVFGGGNMAGVVKSHDLTVTSVDEYGNPTNNTSTSNTDGSSIVNVKGGQVSTGIYGGNNLSGTIEGPVDVNIYGGLLGTNTNPMTDGIFGGGYGNETRTTGNVTVTVNKLSNQVAPTIYGDVYGGSGYGDVNTPAEDVSGTDPADITTVNILDGTIHGDIYGGGLGDKEVEGDDTHHDYPAKVNGKVYVNIGIGEVDQNGCVMNLAGDATITGSVYGCNNINGTPLDDVFVNIYKTAHETANAYPDDPDPTAPDGGWNLTTLATNASTQQYALSAVYGGGNKAAYLPPLHEGNPGTPCCATVHVWGCAENTIYDVYGGGNAADVGSTGNNGVAANTHVIIDGGRIHRSFGGGNGFSSTGNHTNSSGENYNPGANIYGMATSNIYGGLIDEVYGGANQYGSIDNIDLNVSSSSCCNDKAVYGKVFGCANEAPINHDIVTTIGCGVGEIGELYGGSNLAPIGVNDPNHKANVTLNLYGGDYQTVFGGSKGRLDDPSTTNVDESVEANIYGDVTLNLYGGKVVDAFGGSDQLGSIKGIITVNVLDDEKCGLDLTNVYGGSRLANYDPWRADGTPNGPMVESPIVNVMHIHNEDVVGEQQVMKGIRGNVFGGGYQATVTSKPVVNIGYEADVVIYGETTMEDLIPNNYPQASSFHTSPLAYITGNVFGGGDLANVSGKATVNMRQTQSGQSRLTKIFGGGNEAGVGASEVNVYNGTVATAVYGGCNTQGNVAGNVAVNVYGGTLGTTTDPIGIFGGGYGGPDTDNNNPGTTTNGNVVVTIGGTGYAPSIIGNVYGGSALGSVSAPTKITKVELKSGTVTGNVFGGGLGNSTTAAIVNSDIQVVGNGGNVVSDANGNNGWVFGANDQNGDPAGKVEVIINGGTITNVVGGGNVAAYTAPTATPNSPYVNITGGTVTHKVVGGGNEANVTGNPRIVIDGGTIGINDESDAGIYGGCNTTGNVNGNTVVTLTGGFVGVEVVNVGTPEEPEYNVSQYHTARIHGGGYGQATKVTGNVTVNYGAIEYNATGDEEVFAYDLILKGELYGGSALGEVNTNIGSINNLRTTVNLLNGTIYGEAYGGGLGIADDPSTTDVNEGVEATVFGEVHVNVGSATNPYDEETFRGMADLVHCDVYGGNNVNGTPKKDIYVDVYKTSHDDTDFASYVQSDATYAIDEVFGGGNRSNYSPGGADNTIYMYFHLCDNTVRRVFGGGNAAIVPSVNLTLDGGRYDYIFGGGNGEIAAAAVSGNVNINYGGIHSHYIFGGCNQGGQNPTQNAGVGGTVNMDNTHNNYCDETLIEYFFLGGNATPVTEDINATFSCAENQKYVNVYCGCNVAQITGNINVTIEGGTFDKVFGGSRGSNTYASDIDGDVNLIITGGTIGELYGGCDINGNISGKINIEVYDGGSTTCPLFIGDIYGAGNQTSYAPTAANLNGAYSPKVKILKGTIGGTTENLPVQHGNPNTFVGNVFGGGNLGNVTSNPKVIVGDGLVDGNGTPTTPVTIEGNVFGGGDRGDVTGSPIVVVVPATHTLTINQPQNTSSGVFRVYNSLGEIITSGTVTLGEDLDLRIEAIPSIYGYKFNSWSVTANTGSSVDSPTSASTIFTMGTADATLTAGFETVATHTLTVTQGEHGSFTVKDRLGNPVDTSRGISEGAVLYLEATPAENYRFVEWVVGGTNASVGSSSSTTTTFIMGTSETSTITATFAPTSGSGRHRRR